MSVAVVQDLLDDGVLGDEGENLRRRSGVESSADSPSPRDSVLRLGSYRSIEFSATTAVPECGGGEVRIPMEDDAHLTEQGYVYFRRYQTEWYLTR